MGAHGLSILLVGLALALILLNNFIELKHPVFFSFLRYEACSSQRVGRFDKPVAESFRVTMFLKLPIFNHEDLVAFLEVFDLMRDHDHCFCLAEFFKAFMENLLSYLCVNTGKRTVKQVNVCL